MLVFRAMLLGSSTVRRLPFSIYAQLQCKWLSGVADKKTGLETEVQKPSIKLKPEETLYKKRNEVPKAAPKPSYFTSFYLDTHDSVLQLQTAGYNQKQAEAVVQLVVEIQRNSLAPLQDSVLSQQDLELAELRVKMEIEELHNQLMLLEHTHLKAVKNKNEMLKDKVEKLMSSFKDEVTKVQSNLQLDLNLEKGRIKEEATVLMQQVNGTNNRIDKEVAQIRTQIEAQKLESVKYFAGVSLSVVTVVLSVVLGLWRLLK